MGMLGKMVHCEMYFERRGFERVRSFPGADVVLPMQRDGVDYRAHIEGQWLERVQPVNIDRRLDRLSASHFLLTHAMMWIGFTTSGQDTISETIPSRRTLT
jgi:hypothetical protein